MLHNYTYCNARIAQHETNNSPKIKELLMCVCISHSNRKTATAAPITIREDDVVRWPTQCFKKRWVFQKAVTACDKKKSKGASFERDLNERPVATDGQLCSQHSSTLGAPFDLICWVWNEESGED